MIIVPIEKRLNWQSPPIALIAIFLLNVLVFIFYQSDDDEKMNQTVNQYIDSGLSNIEWPIYRQYYQQEYNETLPENFTDNAQLYIQDLLFDQQFLNYIDKRRQDSISSYDRELSIKDLDALALYLKEWETNREEVKLTYQSLSSISYGFIAADNNYLTYLTYQFLHGDMMHLAGNMVFLLLFGFAVEAALGSLRFILYYLIGGIGASGLFMGYTTYVGGDLTVPLVGASGSISAVMAMYISMYRLKRIEFFYWIFLFVGYFRAPAVLLLLIYIFYEIIKLSMYDSSNVAYMAHIGGFVTGAVLIFLTQIFMRKSIDEDYLENTPQIDPYLLGLNQVYQDIAAFKLKQAYKRNEALSEKFGQRHEIEEIRLNLLKGLSENTHKKFLMKRMSNKNNQPIIVAEQLKLWQQLDDSDKLKIPIIEKVNLAISSLVSLEQDDFAKSMFKELFESGETVKKHSQTLSELACALGSFYRKQGQTDLSDKFLKIGRELIGV